MRTSTTRSMMIRLAALLALNIVSGCGENQNSGNSQHAERIYRLYQEATGNQVSISLTQENLGDLSAYEGKTLINKLLDVPSYWLIADSSGPDITNIRRADRTPSIDEWQKPTELQEFDRLGYPIEGGKFRIFAVSVQSKGEVVSSHQSMEICWPAQNHCLVLDPVMVQLTSLAERREELLAAGWKRIITYPAVPSSEYKAQTRSCTLNSQPSQPKMEIYQPAYIAKYVSYAGPTQVEAYLGAQQAGITCYVSGTQCLSSGFGYSYTSSCWSNFGFSCNCNNTGNQVGTSGSTTKSISETKCAHAALASASANWSLNGSGASLSIMWNTSGSLDSNGAQLYDACSWH